MASVVLLNLRVLLSMLAFARNLSQSEERLGARVSNSAKCKADYLQGNQTLQCQQMALCTRLFNFVGSPRGTPFSRIRMDGQTRWRCPARSCTSLQGRLNVSYHAFGEEADLKIAEIAHSGR